MRRIAISLRAGIATGCLATLAVVSILPGCATVPTGPREELDESTGTTLLIVQHPLIFARPRVDVAAHTRDYVTLVGTEEDRSGRYTAWLVAHRWSTVDPRMGGQSDASASLHVIADDREFTLQRTDPPPGFLKRGDLLFAPHAAAAHPDAYPVDDATLRYIAGASRLLVRVGESDPLPPYALWDDGREALLQLVELVPRSRRPGPARQDSGR